MGLAQDRAKWRAQAVWPSAKPLPQGQLTCPEDVKARGPRGTRSAGHKAHIGEVQASVWDDETIRACQNAGVILL